VVADEWMPRVRLVSFGAYSIDIEVRAYIDTVNYNEFLAAQEELLTMIHRLVDEVGSAIAFPATTAYLARDHGLGADGTRDQARPAPDEVVQASHSSG